MTTRSERPSQGASVPREQRSQRPAATDARDWRVRAECQGMDSALFFHPEGERNPFRARRTAKAKEICARCPVIEECREFALRTREPYGVWGGLSESEREAIINKSRPSST